MTDEVAALRAGLRRIARTLSPREMSEQSGVSYSTIYRLIGQGPAARPNRETFNNLRQYVAKWQKSPAAANELPTEPYTPGPLVTKLGPRQQEIVRQYLRRLEAAGLGEEELIMMEHLLADRSYSQRFSSTRGGPLTDDEEILLLESTWRAIADTLALRGIRP